MILNAFNSVEARGVSKAFGRERALSPLDLTLSAGEAVALVGPNGAGKSTLVGILATLIQPTTGEVRFGGARADARCRGGIGVIAHDPLCYGDLSGRENLGFFARIYHLEDGARRADELLERVGLAGAADRAARTYSRGMLQRLAVARALLHHPRLLLLDEPFTGLDREGSAMLRRLLEEERARGVILLVVSHDLEPLPGLVERAIVLRRGKLVHDHRAPDAVEGFRALVAGEAA
jgi:heme exporter protein A